MVERWRPRAEIERMLEEMDRLLPMPFRWGRTLPRMFTMRHGVDLYETPDQLVIKALVPGATPDDIDISLDHQTLTIRARYGYTLPEDEAEAVTWHFQEIDSGQFTETVTLPVPVEPEQVTATLQDGILTVTLRKTAETRARRIPVRTTGADSDGASGA